MGSPERIGRYTLTARLATGGMAEVFLARQQGPEGFSKTVVIKRLLPHLARNPSIVEMFLTEARLAARFDHPNVISVFDLGQEGEDFFIAMEFLDGRSLAEMLAAAGASRLPVHIGVKILAEALAGLHHVHEARGEDGTPLGIVHRDFSPDNIVVSFDGRIKVVDFGVAKIAAAANQTDPGTLKGKYFYMSPETILGKPIDRRADLFAAGVTLYELLTGQRPYGGDSPHLILGAIVSAAPPPPGQLDPTVSPRLDALCVRLLSRDPAARPATAATLRAELEDFLRGDGAPAGADSVAAYLERLFPHDDPERSRIAELRRAQTPLTLGRGTPAPALAPSPRGEALPSADIAPSPRSWRWAVAALAALLAAGGAYALLRGPKIPAAERLARAETLLKQGKHKEALAQLEAASNAKLPSTEALMRYGRELLDEGDPAEAEGVFRKLLSLKESAAGHAALGDTLAARRFGAKAQAEYELAIKLEPASSAGYRGLGELNLARGELSAAVGPLQKAYKLSPRDAKVAYSLGLLLSRSGQLDDAEKALVSAVALDPGNASALAELGFVDLRQGNEKRALSRLTLAVQKQPELAQAHYYLGVAAFHAGQKQRALEAHRDAVRLDPKLAIAFEAMGQVYESLKKPAEAKDAYRKAVALDSRLGEAQEALRRLGP